MIKKLIRIGDNLIGCEYCRFKDLCYRKEEDIMNIDNKKFEDIMEDYNGMDK